MKKKGVKLVDFSREFMKIEYVAAVFSNSFHVFKYDAPITRYERWNLIIHVSTSTISKSFNLIYKSFMTLFFENIQSFKMSFRTLKYFKSKKSYSQKILFLM